MWGGYRGALNADLCGCGFSDDVLVTKDGYENLTTAPKAIEEMEKIMKGGA